MKNKNLMLPVILLMSVCCSLSFAQIKSDALLVSISPSETVSSQQMPRKFQIRVENKAAGTIRLWSRNVTLGISPVASGDIESGFAQSYFAFVGIGKDKIEGGEKIELEVRLDELHWYSTWASAFIVSEKPNLAEIGRIFPGKYRLVAVADITPKKQEKLATFYRSQSESLEIELAK